MAKKADEILEEISNCQCPNCQNFEIVKRFARSDKQEFKMIKREAKFARKYLKTVKRPVRCNENHFHNCFHGKIKIVKRAFKFDENYIRFVERGPEFNVKKFLVFNR